MAKSIEKVTDGSGTISLSAESTTESNTCLIVFFVLNYSNMEKVLDCSLKNVVILFRAVGFGEYVSLADGESFQILRCGVAVMGNTSIEARGETC